MNKLALIFRLPSAHEVATKMLAKAKRDLLCAESQREQAALIATYQKNLIERLTRQLGSGELL